MALPAQVTSIEAVESFRAGLIVYLSKARAALDEVQSEMLRVRLWLQNDQRRKWEQELRLRLRRSEEAKNELFAARISTLQTASSLQHMAVQRTDRAIHEAEAKLKVLAKWEREMQNRTDPLTKQVEQLQGYLANDMGKAVTHLAQIVKTLDAYADITSAPVTSPATPPPEPKGPEA